MALSNSASIQNFLVAANDTSRVSGLTHTYYKYPARLSPTLVREAIEAFTDPGDWILDPFVGGGTTLVEARALGRSGVGADSNELAIFVSKVKTSPLTIREVNQAHGIAFDLVETGKLGLEYSRPWSWIEAGYLKNLDSSTVWRVRKQIEIALDRLGGIRNRRLQMFLRCALLRTAQWALDNRRATPSVHQFRQRFFESVLEMTEGMSELTRSERNSIRYSELTQPVETHLLHARADQLEKDPKIDQLPSPKLVITSPPYPGVHVLYHRWQIHGRKETSAPYWIANCLDGHGGSHYTLGHREEIGLRKYFLNLEAAFRSVVAILDPGTVVVQVVAFSEPSWQLPRYLDVMADVGLIEMTLPSRPETEDGRLWRAVPGRRWYATQKGEISSSRELILLHTAN